MTISYLLLGDGASDDALLHPIAWLLRELRPPATFRQLAYRTHHGRLRESMESAVSDYEPDLLFVHRDAERSSRAERAGEIPLLTHATVRVVPVRMTEAWMLIEERAIRLAAGNPNGDATIDLPRLRDLESLPDPKAVLNRLLVTASGHTTGRRRKRFQRDMGAHMRRVAEVIEDYAPLDALPSFIDFRDETCRALDSLNAAED